MNNKMRVLQALSDCNDQTNAEIAQKTGLDTNQTRSALQKLLNDRHVARKSKRQCSVCKYRRSTWRYVKTYHPQRRGTNRAVILDALASGEMTGSEIAHYTGLDVKGVHNALQVLKLRKDIVCRGKRHCLVTSFFKYVWSVPGQESSEIQRAMEAINGRQPGAVYEDQGVLVVATVLPVDEIEALGNACPPSYVVDVGIARQWGVEMVFGPLNTIDSLRREMGLERLDWAS